MEGRAYLFVEPLTIGEQSDKYEMGEKSITANGGKEANGEVASNGSHPDQ